jgi:hypothetical protein
MVSARIFLASTPRPATLICWFCMRASERLDQFCHLLQTGTVTGDSESSHHNAV